MLHIMPLIWCGVLIILFAAHLAAGFRPAASAAATIAALAASVAGLRPWAQVALMGLSWLLMRLFACLRPDKEKESAGQ